ncbi:lipocalin family protein [Capnocytophaga felis]|nr:lipocalin family protein [Capnocytophaga felis]
MRRILFFMGAVLLFTACGKDDGKTSTDISELLGMWQLESLVRDGQANVPNNCERQWKQDFRENNELIFHHSDLQADGSCKSEIVKYTYQVSGNQIIFSNEQGKIVNTFSVKEGKLSIVTPANQSRTGKEEIAIYTKVTADSGNTSTDPLIGNWRVRVIQDASATVEVTDKPCVKDTNLKVDATTVLFTLYLPNPKTNECKSAQEQYKWSKQGDTYYYEANGQKYKLPIELRDNNQSLMLDYPAQSGNIKFYFTRN